MSTARPRAKRPKAAQGAADHTDQKAREKATAQLKAAKQRLIFAAAAELDRYESQNHAAKAIGVQQPIISRIVREDTAGFTLERLLRYATALGLDVKVEISVKPARGRRGVVKVLDR